MNRQTAYDSSRSQVLPQDRWVEFLWIAGLFLAALILYTWNLGGLPLRDWDEGTIAQVASEIANAPSNSLKWLFPTLWGEPYMNKPPLVHGLIAILYSTFGVNEWTTRLPSAILTAFSVPILYSLAREIFPARTPAIFSALIYLNLLPIVRHGRLAMLDGAVLCFGILMIWFTLRSRRDLRFALGVGLSFALICLSKGLIAILFAAIAFSFIIWDTPRLLSSLYLWIGIFLGSLPVIGWYAAQLSIHPDSFIQVNIFAQFFQRIYTTVEDNTGPPWYYVWEILKYSSPWLIFSIYGWKLAWENRIWGWAKLIIVWSSISFLLVSFMVTKLPWYILPFYPSLALAGGVALAEVINWPSDRKYPRNWLTFLAFLGISTIIASVYFLWESSIDNSLTVICGGLGLTLLVSSLLISRRDQQFIPLLFWGFFISLLLFFTSSHWVWELNESYPVKPVAAIIRVTIPTEQVVYTSYPYNRPSLNFYSQHQVIPASNEELKKLWQTKDNPYLLIDAETFDKLSLDSPHILGKAEPDWLLITKSYTQ